MYHKHFNTECHLCVLHMAVAARLVKFDSEGVVKLKMDVFLASVSLELSSGKGAIFKGASTGLCVCVCIVEIQVIGGGVNVCPTYV